MEKQKWYAVQVRAGKEHIVAELCRKQIGNDILKECFVPMYERKRRYEGMWHKEELRLFPGYIFMVTEQIHELFKNLKEIPELTKILGVGNEFVPLKDSEVKFLRETGGDKYLLKVSEGYITGKQVIITSGPMTKLVGEIKFIDRHKRMAIIQTEMFGRIMDIRLGLEIVTKVEK